MEFCSQVRAEELQRAEIRATDSESKALRAEIRAAESEARATAALTMSIDEKGGLSSCTVIRIASPTSSFKHPYLDALTADKGAALSARLEAARARLEAAETRAISIERRPRLNVTPTQKFWVHKKLNVGLVLTSDKQRDF